MPLRRLTLISRGFIAWAISVGAVGQEVRHLVLVVGVVERHAQQRPAVDVAIGRIEIEVVASMAHDRAVRAMVIDLEVVLRDRPLPFGAPFRRARRAPDGSRSAAPPVLQQAR